MSDYDRKTNDWQAKVFVDFGAGALLAGYVCHLRMASASAKVAVHGVYIGGGVGIGAGVDVNVAGTIVDKLVGVADVIPSVGQDMKVTCFRPFSARDIASCPAAIFNAGVAAGLAPADCKVIALHNFCHIVEAKATAKIALEVQANLTVGGFVAFYPMLLESSFVKQEKMRKRPTDMYSGFKG